MKTLLFLGDSITDCGHSFDPENLGNGYVRMIAENFSAQKKDVKILNKGIDGFTVPAINRLWKQRCLNIRPDFITLLVGINDLAVLQNTGINFNEGLKIFEENYRTLLEDIRLMTDCPLLLMEPYIFPYPAEFSSWEPGLRKICKIIEKLAASCHADFLPLWKSLNTAALEQEYSNITTDGIHLTKKGHQILAKSWQLYYQSVASSDSLG